MTAVLFPIVGVILGILTLAKNRVGQGIAIIALAVVVSGAWWAAASGAFDENADECIVLAAGGNKLCGDDAAAWCDATDELRDAVGDVESQLACDRLRN